MNTENHGNLWETLFLFLVEQLNSIFFQLHAKKTCCTCIFVLVWGCYLASQFLVTQKNLTLCMESIVPRLQCGYVYTTITIQSLDDAMHVCTHSITICMVSQKFMPRVLSLGMVKVLHHSLMEWMC